MHIDRFLGRGGMALAIALGTAAPADAADGAALFKSRCVACHGAAGAGNAALLAPPIAGQDEAYLARQLQLFRSRQRGGDAPSGAVAGMQAVAQGLTDDAAVLALARHVAKLKAPVIKAAPPPAGSPLNAGKATYSVCMACHGSHGEGNTALAAPRLNHLPSWYTLSQLQAYRAGARGTHADDKPGQQMRQIAQEVVIDDETAKTVAEYITTLGTDKR